MSGSELAHADSPYPVLPCDTPPTLPDGFGGIAVHTRCPAGAERHTLAPIVGVDGRPAVYGWGDALVVVPAGERLVEVQYVEPMQSTMVSVAAGQVVDVEYVAAGDGVSPGALGGLGRRAARGGGYNPLGYAAVILAMLVVFDAGVYLLSHPVGLGLGAAGLIAAVVVLAGGVPALVALYRRQHRPARQRRRQRRQRRRPAQRRGER